MATQRDQNRRRVLLTGANGFVGRPCLDLLIEGGWEVHAVTSRPVEEIADASQLSEAIWHQADLLDPEASRELVHEIRPTHLLHLAWTLDPGGDVYRSPRNFKWVAASLDLLQTFTECGGQRAVFTGSGAEYDWRQGLCSEATTRLRPASTYGLCKRTLGELFCDFVANHGPEGGGAWARLFFLFGPHEQPRRLIPAVINSILRGEPTRCSHGRQIRDYLFSLDAAEALVKLLDSEINGAINVASGEPTRLGALIHRTAERLERADLVELGAIPVPEDDPPMVVADIRRLRQELGWQPRWELDDALDHTIDWWRRQNHAPGSPS